LTLLVLLALPLDVSGNAAIALVALAVLGMYLIALLWATVSVSRQGASWLEPTPISLWHFARAILLRSYLAQLQWTVAGAIFVIVAGVDTALVLRVAEFWLAVVAATSSIATTQAYRSRSMGLRIIAVISLLTVLEGIRRYAALPCALMLSAWHFRQEERG